MEGSFMVPLLTFATLCAVVVFALVSAPNTTRPGKTPVDT